MKKSGQLILGLAVAAGAVWYTVRNVSVRDLADSFRTLDYTYLLPCLLMIALTYVARAIRWRALVAPVKPVPTLELFSPLMIGFMAGILPARAGELVRAYLLGKKAGLSFAGALATIVVERLFDLVLLLLLFGWILMSSGDIFDSDLSWSGIRIHDLAFQFGLASLVLVAGLVVFIYLLVAHHDRALALVHWLMRPLPESWGLKLVEMVGTFSQGLEVVRKGRDLAFIALTTALVWGFIVLQYYPLYWAYDLENKSLESAVLLTVMICILITVLPTPAFLGSFNAGVLIALHEILGEAELAAVSLSFVAWTLNFLVIVGGGVYFMLHDHISVKGLTDLERD